MSGMMPGISSGSNARVSLSAALVEEMREIVRHAVSARRGRGKAEAVFQTGRDLGLAPRRIEAILWGEVRRVWADELETARIWYARHCTQEERRHQHEAEQYRLRAAALRERIR